MQHFIQHDQKIKRWKFIKENRICSGKHLNIYPEIKTYYYKKLFYERYILQLEDIFHFDGENS